MLVLAMLIHVAVASDTAKSIVRHNELIELQTRSRTQRHQLTDNPEAAEIILLAGDLESLAEAQANKLIQLYPEKTMAYSEIDALVPYLPGVYGSAGRATNLNLRRTQSNIYFSRFGSSRNPEVRHRPHESKELLFCFRGRRDCRVRTNILDYPYNRQDVHVLETTGFMHWKDGVVGNKEAQRDFADIMAHSHFALCPRGMGLGSIRLFEAMEMGVAPVLLSDRYALPPGPDWGSFLLRIPERDFGRLPELLEPRVSESEERGRRARDAWEQFFAPELVFDRMIDQLINIRKQRIISERWFRYMWPILQAYASARPWVTGAARGALDKAKQSFGGKSRNERRADP